MAVVETTAVFSASKTGLAGRIEEAMAGAALQARAEGVTDPAEVRARMMAARERVKAAAG